MRTERLLKVCAFVFMLISVVTISASIYFYLHSAENAKLANWSYAALVGAERYAVLPGLIAAIVSGLFVLRLLVMRLNVAKQSLQQRNRQLEILTQSNQHINEHLEVPAVMRALVDSALKLTDASDGAAGLFKDGQMVFTEYYKDGEWLPIDLSFPPGYGVPGWVIENKRPYLANDTSNDLQVIQEIREQLGIYNLIDTPKLNAHGELLCCFEIHKTKDRRPFKEQDIVLLTGLSASASVAIENARFIAEQKKSASLLRESEGKFRSLFENSPTSLWEEDFSAVKLFLDEIRKQGVSDLSEFFKSNTEAATRCAHMVKVVDVNQKTVNLFSARTKADLLSNLNLIFTDKSLEPFIYGIITLASGQTFYKTTGINKTLNGEELEVNIHASIIPGYEDTWEKIIVSMADITREREVDRLKNEFISTAAHELRTPLTVIMGYSDLMLEHLEKYEFSIEQKKEFLYNINNKVATLERIVEDLLDVNKIESGRPLLLDKAPTNLAKLLKELIRNHQRETKRHRITTDFDEISLLMMLDAGRIIQVLNNLINNAIKYSPDGGDIEIRVTQENDQLEISVADQGLGMTEEQLDRVFDKFYRVDTSNTAIAGLGLGMSIAKNIIEAHGGQIGIESTPSQGTTVRFNLPIQAECDNYFSQEISGSSQVH